jgi:DhnA family fructose-bisphosphate aldolase class Ia
VTVAPRIRRLFAADGRCFDVAVDHGFFGEPRFLAGIEDLAAALDVLVEAAPDAIQLSPGSAPLLQERPGTKPALVLRTDVADVYGPAVDPDRRYFSELVPEAVEGALRLDAACVVVNLLWLPGQQELHRACLRNVAALKARCEPAGMPLMVEPLAMRPGADGYAVDGDAERIRALVRQAVELGADVIKADPTDDLADYPDVIRVAGRIPVLVRGGGRAPDEEVLTRTHTVIEAGAAGIVYGRNVIQHERPREMTRALMAVVHEGASAGQALERLRG